MLIKTKLSTISKTLDTLGLQEQAKKLDALVRKAGGFQAALKPLMLENVTELLSTLAKSGSWPKDDITNNFLSIFESFSRFAKLEKNTRNEALDELGWHEESGREKFKKSLGAIEKIMESLATTHKKNYILKQIRQMKNLLSSL